MLCCLALRKLGSFQVCGWEVLLGYVFELDRTTTIDLTVVPPTVKLYERLPGRVNAFATRLEICVSAFVYGSGRSVVAALVLVLLLPS